MVDTSDLKSGDYIGREGSSPSGPNKTKINIYILRRSSLFIPNSRSTEIFPVRTISIIL
jgi:hypothetical protein